jgi:hypothetical protein
MYVYLILSLLPGSYEKTEHGFKITPAIVLVFQWLTELVKTSFAKKTVSSASKKKVTK